MVVKFSAILMMDQVFSAEFLELVSIQLRGCCCGGGIYCAELRPYWGRLIFEVCSKTQIGIIDRVINTQGTGSTLILMLNSKSRSPSSTTSSHMRERP